jgi:hypothetical protein
MAAIQRCIFLCIFLVHFFGVRLEWHLLKEKHLN